MLAGVGKIEAKANGRKNVASSDKGKGKKRVSCYCTCFFGNLLKLSLYLTFFFLG